MTETVPKESQTSELDAIIDRAQGHEQMRRESQQEVTDVIRRKEGAEQYVRTAEWVRDQVQELEKEMETLSRYMDDPKVRAAYEVATRRLVRLRDRFEDLTRLLHEIGSVPSQALEAERQVNEIFARVQGISSETENLEQDRAAVEYEQRVQDIMSEVVDIEDAFEQSAKAGVTPKQLTLLHRWLDEAQEHVQEADQEYSARNVQPARSHERKTLIELINRIRAKYPMSGLTSVYALHEDVRATYAGISHALTLEQRRALRPRIAQLTALIRKAEAEGDVVITMARATELAPAVAVGAVGPRAGSRIAQPPIPPVPPTTPDAIEA